MTYLVEESNFPPGLKALAPSASFWAAMNRYARPTGETGSAALSGRVSRMVE